MPWQVNSAAAWTMMLITATVVAVESPHDVDKTSSTSDMDIIRRSQGGGQLQHRADPVRGSRRPLPSSVQLVAVDGRRIQRRVGVSTDDEDVASNSTNHDDAALLDRLRLARIRRKNFRLLTILKRINDRIGRGASPPPARAPWNLTSSSGCVAVSSSSLPHRCDHLPPLTDDATETTVNDVHIVAQSCVRSEAAPTYRRGSESVEHVDGDDGLKLEFGGLETTTTDCRSVARDNQIRRSKLVVYIRANETDTGRMRRRQHSVRRQSEVSSDKRNRDRRRRKRNVLLLSVYQEMSLNRRRQRKKQKLVGKKRVRKSFTGWLSISVQPRLSTCSRRRRAPQHGQPLTLLLRLTDLDGSTTADVSQLVSTPIKCNTTDEHLVTASTSGLQEILGNVNSTGSQQPYLELSIRLMHAGRRQNRRQHRTQRRHSTAN